MKKINMHEGQGIMNGTTGKNIIDTRTTNQVTYKYDERSKKAKEPLHKMRDNIPLVTFSPGKQFYHSLYRKDYERERLQYKCP